ncbi:pseudoazurin [Marinomonas aquiplantarum]|uniref:Pseudoazurin n=1 Tax=Marinomonas aquiplantarum TaxID=491951 RepID=A0A366D1Q5_9GAMM|nr:pseudoazurin [Marinomonas aquiplantarum]RBO83876.1 pseudoazurin [Marinomonas aquiplantarum]
MRFNHLVTSVTLSILLIGQQVHAKEWQIQMLNYGSAEQGGMIFEPAFIHAQVGDTITFLPSHSGHNAQSYVVPEGSRQWKSSLDKEYTFTLDAEGIHLYYCPPHLMMGMVGMIQVGAAKNQALIDKKAPRLRSKMALKPERMDALLSQIR